MAMRVTGMYSGLDTESIISELVAAKKTKVEDLTKAQTKLSWKQDAWKSLNTKISSLYNGAMDTLKYQASYFKKTTKCSSSAATVITSDSAMNSVQKLKIKSLASSGYMTGGKIAGEAKATTSMAEVLSSSADGGTFGTDETATIKIKVGETEKEISLSATDTLTSVATKLKAAGVNANYDATSGRLFVSSTESGAANDFTITAGDDDLSKNILDALGLNTASATNAAMKNDGSDAEIELNGATFTSTTNTFDINGLTITCSEETGDNAITLTTENDTSGIYDMIKKFITEYSSLINEMDKLYNADSTKSMDALTDDEKEAMSDTEVEKWETKIKDSILRRDDTLSTVSSAMKEIMSAGVSVNGKTMYLSDFGIETLNYFTAADNEKNAYHINGDEDDTATKSEENDLEAMISKDPDTVMNFFTGLSQTLYEKMSSLMAGTDYSSSYTVYDDKKMKEDYDDYTTKIKEAEEKLQDYEDKWYSKFSAMETALAKLQSNSSAVTSLLGS